MFWEVMLPGENGAAASVVTVEAENWFSALRSSLLKGGAGGQLISNLTCDIKPDRSVHVTDFVTRKVFTLKPLESAPRPAVAAAPAPADPALEGLPAGLPAHSGFARRDEAATDASGIFYRERMLAVAPGTDKEEAAKLAVAVFERLKAMGTAEGTKLFAAVQVFDHAFQGRFERPAIAALEWKEWSPKKAKIQFPLSGAEEVRFSRVSMPPAIPAAAPEPVAAPTPAPMAAPMPAPAPIAEVPIDLTPAPAAAPIALVPKAAPVVATPAPAPVAVPLAAPVAPAPRSEKRPSAEMRAVAGKDAPRKRQTGEGAVLDDVFFQAFERMHEIYSYRDHDKVAEFALGLAREFIKCEAGSAMLITPGKYELYVAAAQGDVARALLGRRLSLTKGIVGFATRAGAVVTVSDPARDPRFHGEFDQETSFKTRNIVCAPIQFEGKTIGAIELLNSPRESGFLQSEANVLSYIAGAVGEYVDTSLPSREADFSDKEFAEFLPARKAEAARRAAEKKDGKPQPQLFRPAPAAASAPAKAAAQPAPAAKPQVKTTMAETPAAKKVQPPPAQPASKGKKKRKR